MKTAIVYYSTHHENTKKLAEAIAKECGADLFNILESADIDLSGYDIIGLASGIYYGKFGAELIDFAKEKLPENRKVFFLYSCGRKRKGLTDAIKEAAESRSCRVIGEFGCNGWDTYGPFRLIGGINKQRPDDRDADAAVRFFNEISAL
ncbi:MAG: flavodoxin family protein [Lachnospiraceae bacterium]|nr:flavodoxin family protein [Lachnospiraceae bacterium]